MGTESSNWPLWSRPLSRPVRAQTLKNLAAGSDDHYPNCFARRMPDAFVRAIRDSIPGMQWDCARVAAVLRLCVAEAIAYLTDAVSTYSDH